MSAVPAFALGPPPPSVTKSFDAELRAACVRFSNDPLGFTLFMYRWGQGVLTGWDGPDAWHREIFAVIKAYLESDDDYPLLIAVASGHGAAKTALTMLHLLGY